MIIWKSSTTVEIFIKYRNIYFLHSPTMFSSGQPRISGFLGAIRESDGRIKKRPSSPAHFFVSSWLETKKRCQSIAVKCKEKTQAKRGASETRITYFRARLREPASRTVATEKGNRRTKPLRNRQVSFPEALVGRGDLANVFTSWRTRPALSKSSAVHFSFPLFSLLFIIHAYIRACISLSLHVDLCIYVQRKR